MISLTGQKLNDILNPPSKKTKAGIETPSNQGPKRPQSYVAFLCPSKTPAAVCRLDSVMVGCIGQPLKRLAGSLAGSLNPIQSATQRLRPKGGGLSLYQGVPAMRNYAQTPADFGQSTPKILQSSFNLVRRTANENRVICTGLTFSQAASLVNEIPGSLIKFSRMEGSK
jgi:hypothetical protein